MSVTLKADLEHIICPNCGVHEPTMLYPNQGGYRFYCGSCGHEERIFKDGDDWYWLAQRAEAAVEVAS